MRSVLGKSQRALDMSLVFTGDRDVSDQPNLDQQTFLLTPCGQDYVGVNSYDYGDPTSRS